MPVFMRTLMHHAIALMIPALILLFLSGSKALAAPAAVSISIRGIDGDALENVRAAVELPPGMVEDGTVNRQWLDWFVEGIPEKARRALEPFGYYNADATAGLTQAGGNRFVISVMINARKQVRLESVEVEARGSGVDDPWLTELLAAFPLREGEPLLHARYEAAKGELRSAAIEQGYLDASFAVSRVEVLPEQASASVRLVLETGPRYRFGEVEFEGQGPYLEQYLERYLAFKPGDVFSYTSLGETQLNLSNTDRFTRVLVTPLREQSSKQRIPVAIRLEPAPTKRLRPGIGYATDTGPRLSLQYRDLNVFDRAHELQAEASISPKIQMLGAGYRIPSTQSMDSAVGVEVNVQREEAPSFTNRIASAELSQTLGFGRGRLGRAGVRFQQEVATVGGIPTQSRLVVPGLRFSERRYDNLVRPTRGHFYAIDLRGTDRSLGSDTEFTQVVAEGSVMRPLGNRSTVLARLRAGSSFRYEPSGFIPISYRFFAGGDRSIRGYAYQSIGPRDAAGTIIGGRDLLVGAIELERSLSRSWGAAIFYDAGNAVNSFRNLDLVSGAGIGGRYYTPAGAFRLDIARQIDAPDPSYRIHFTVGFGF